MPRLMHKYFDGLRAVRHLVPLIWLAIAGCGAHWGPAFFDNLEDRMRAPAGSASNISDGLFWHEDQFDIPDAAVAFLQLLGAPPASGSIEGMAEARQWVDTIEAGSAQDGPMSFYSLNGTDYSLLAPRLVSADGRAMVMVFDGYWGCGSDTRRVTALVNGANPDPTRFYTGFTGRDAMDCFNSDAATHDLGRMDSVGIPLALLVLAWRVNSLPLMLCALLALPTGLLAALLVLGRTSTTIMYPSFSPALFVSTAVAMTFDWSLFMLSRYREGVDAGHDNDACVRDVVVYSGHTVVVSGVTLAIAFLSLAGFPVEFLQATGKGAAVTLVACMLVSMSLTPALLLLFPRFFRWKPRCGYFRRRRALHEKERNERIMTHGESTTVQVDSDSDDADEAHVAPTHTAASPVASVKQGLLAHAAPMGVGGGSIATAALSAGNGYGGVASGGVSAGGLDKAAQVAAARARQMQRDSPWFKLARFVARRPAAVLIGVLVAMAPVSYMSSRLAVTVDQNQMHARTQPAYEVWQRFAAAFPSGMTWPYALMSQPGAHATSARTARAVQRAILGGRTAGGPVDRDGLPEQQVEPAVQLAPRLPVSLPQRRQLSAHPRARGRRRDCILHRGGHTV